MRPELLKYFDGTPATALLVGSEARQAIEEGIEDLFNLSLERDECATVSCDPYDWSLEINIHGVAPTEFKITTEQAATILSWGCSHFWVNLGGDGDTVGATHEIYVSNGAKIGELRGKR